MKTKSAERASCFKLQAFSYISLTDISDNNDYVSVAFSTSEHAHFCWVASLLRCNTVPSLYISPRSMLLSGSSGSFSTAVDVI